MKDQKKRTTVFHIQAFSLSDGPGIRTLVFFKGCPLRCLWCHNPESWRALPETSYRPERCILCGACESVCPEDAVSLSLKQRIDWNRCTNCGACAEVCYPGAIKLLGYFVSTRELLKGVLKDRAFFQASSGGITISGGEPTFNRSGFLEDFLSACRDHNLHVVMETCGYFPWEGAANYLGMIDLFLFDLKIFDPIVHKQYTGAGNKTVLQNLIRLKKGSKNVLVRIPLIKGITATEENLLAIADFLKEIGQEEVVLLKYNPLGEGKYQWIKPHKGIQMVDPISSSGMDSEKDMVPIFFRKGLLCSIQ